MTQVREIQLAIATYAAAYAELQRLQDLPTLIPRGDQKTGCIGEFYVQLYLRARYPDAEIRVGGHSEKGWDIEVSSPERVWKVQTKTISEYSKTCKLSPIHAGWDELYIVYLDHTFQPRCFYVIADTAIVSKGSLRECYGPKPGTKRRGTSSLNFGPDRIEEFMQYVGPQLEA
jgi:hypothetical protein